MPNYNHLVGQLSGINRVICVKCLAQYSIPNKRTVNESYYYEDRE